MRTVLVLFFLCLAPASAQDRKSTRLNSSHGYISYAVFCLKKKKTTKSFGFIACVVEIKLLALRDGAQHTQEVLKVDLPSMSRYGDCIRAGRLVCASGLHGL